MDKWIKCVDGNYRPLSHYTILAAYATGGNWAVGNFTNSENIAQFADQPAAEDFLAELVAYLGVVVLA